MTLPNECEHGQLARSCPFCEYDAELRELEERLKKLRDGIVEIAYKYHGKTYIELVLEARKLLENNYEL